ncbi:hypothetical protein H4219_003772 [Mycoemilia scoparia]|uniref:Protein-serine/threonine kinase n=1 Tax=Mycoemilia scoparia TaxID=417184 RepID=A0A9W8DME3_9FUNG|nr:hypothetical protein H4219_003772 [Mycoemilia scoparia]
MVPQMLKFVSKVVGRRRYSSKSLSFEDEKLVLKYATRDIKPVTLRQLMAHGRKPLTESQILESCQYTQNELPVRLAKRVVAFQRLPFIVGMNPYISRVYYQYYEAFERLRSFPPVKTLEDEADFTKALLRQTQLLADVIPTIAQGFHECKKYMKTSDITSFIDELIKARIGLRVIGEQHVELSHQYRELMTEEEGNWAGEAQGDLKNETPGARDGASVLKDWVGSINTNLKPRRLIQQVCLYIQNVCEMHYGTSPEYIINQGISESSSSTQDSINMNYNSDTGNNQHNKRNSNNNNGGGGGENDIVMTYIPSHLEYIVMELLKNSYRATIEHSTRNRRLFHPSINITISKGVKYVGIRIRDEGGGISKSNMSHVFEYSWTTVKDIHETSAPNMMMGANASTGGAGGTFSIQANLDLQAGTGGPIAGLGFGLPMAKLYAGYFGGSLEIMSLEGHGCDVFLKIPCIDLNMDKLVI